jgi:alpha-mannosidase
MIKQLYRMKSSVFSSRVLTGTIAMLFAFLLTPVRSQAQQSARAKAADDFAGQQTADAVKMLSVQSQAVIHVLSQLNSIPIVDWRFHIGDLAHGESVNLNDSSWQLIHAPYQTTTNDIVWLRTWIEVPKNLHGYDLKGSRIWIKSWRNDAVTVYFNGQRVAGGEDLEPIVLFNSANPGDRVLVAVRMGTTDDPKWIPDANLYIDPPVNRPNPQDMYTEFVCAALLIPDLANNLPAEKMLLDKAIEKVDLHALEIRDQQKFDDSLRQSQRDLEPLKPTLREATFYLTGNSHIDAAWLWPWTETVDVVRRTFGTALQLMDEYPNYTYTQSAAQYNVWMADKYPELNAEINRRIQEGRWEVVGGMWVEPDLNMPDGESQVRQLLIGQRTQQQLYGVTTRIGWNPDSFGYNWQLPQIYKKSGMDYFVTQKMAWNETNPLPLKLFWWESPDGSKLLTYFPHSYANEDLDPVRLSNDLVKARTQSPGMLQMMDLFGVGDHGGGPTRAVLDQGMHWMEAGRVVPVMKFATAQSYFSNIEKKVSPNSPVWNYEAMAKGVATLPTPPPGEVSIPTWKDELYFEHHRGTYTTQANQKRNMRESEEWMLNAEKYASLAWLDGQPYPVTELNDAWKKVLFNQFHDLAAGSGIGIIYQDAQHDYDQVRWATQEVSSKALATIQARVDTRAAGPAPVVVFNPLGWQRSGLVKVDVQMPSGTANGVSVLDAKGSVLPSEVMSSDAQTNTYHLLVEVANVPSLGYEVLHVVSRKLPFSSDLKVGGTTLENGTLKVTVDPHNGCITSLYNKKDNFEALAPGGCGNQLQVFKDTPKADDAWNIDPGTLDHFTPLTKVDSVQLIEKEPLRGVIRVSRTWHNSKFVQDIILYANSDQVDVVNDIDWHETHILLKAAFPLAASSNMATYEIPYGTIDRPTTRNNSWEQAKFEVSALRWADLGDGKHGFSLINESKYGYDCKGNLLRLTLLRSPVEPDPNADRGHQHFRYALYPHRGDWKTALTVRRGYEYNYRLRAMQVEPHTGALPLLHSFIRLGDRNVVLTAVKKAEDANGIILHFYEWAGKDSNVVIHVPSGATSATLTNLMEKPEGAPLRVSDSGEITVPVHPYEIVSVRINYSPNRNHDQLDRMSWKQ